MTKQWTDKKQGGSECGQDLTVALSVQDLVKARLAYQRRQRHPTPILLSGTSMGGGATKSRT